MRDASLRWDEPRIVLAIARGGSLAAAARSLGINHSTVFRRLKALETNLGTRLFERHDQGYLPTAAGTDLIAAAERIEAEVQAFERRLVGRDTQLSGTIRVTAPDDVVEALLLQPLSEFSATCPAVGLEVVIDNRMLSLTRREADLAIRPTREPPETLVGRRVGEVASAIYTTTASGDEGAWEEARWIAWDEGSGPPATNRWIAARVSPERIVYRSNSLLNQLSACQAGIGLAVLPCFLGDLRPGLRRVAPPDTALHSYLWILTHRDLRLSARVRALGRFLYGHLRAKAGLLAGA